MTAGIDESGEWPRQSVPHTTAEAAPHTRDAQVDAALARLHDSAESTWASPVWGAASTVVWGTDCCGHSPDSSIPAVMRRSP